jgi:hypothetical protein
VTILDLDTEAAKRVVAKLSDPACKAVQVGGVAFSLSITSKMGLRVNASAHVGGQLVAVRRYLPTRRATMEGLERAVASIFRQYRGAREAAQAA